MIQTVTIKLKIDVPTQEYDNLHNTMQMYSKACDFVSSYIFNTHDLSRYSVQENTYYQVRNIYGLRSQMTVSCVRTVIAKYKTILENQKEWIKPSFNKPQLDLVWNRDYSLKDKVFSLNTLNGRIKCTFHKKGYEHYFDKDIKFGTAKLVFKHGKFYLHIPISFEIEGVTEANICNVVGIDRGVNFVVATYDSKHRSGFVRGKTIKQKRAKYKQIRRELQQRQTPSARRRLKAIGQRENRWMQDVNHCVSKALVESNPKHTLFVLEDLSGVRSATEKVRRKGRYVSVSWSFYDLEQKLKYKAALNESSVITVDPRYTSQTCPVCGHTEKANRSKKMHIFCCKSCGYTSNDDRIGAMNLYRMGIEYLVESQESMSLLSGSQSIAPDVTSAIE